MRKNNTNFIVIVGKYSKNIPCWYTWAWERESVTVSFTENYFSYFTSYRAKLAPKFSYFAWKSFRLIYWIFFNKSFLRISFRLITGNKHRVYSFSVFFFQICKVVIHDVYHTKKCFQPIEGVSCSRQHQNRFITDCKWFLAHT